MFVFSLTKCLLDIEKFIIKLNKDANTLMSYMDIRTLDGH